jgi:2-dehydro-3-deoxygluconokinase
MGRYLLSVMQLKALTARMWFATHKKQVFNSKAKSQTVAIRLWSRIVKGSAATHMGPDDIDVPWLLSARHLHATGVFAAISNSSFFTAQKTMDLMRRAGRSVFIRSKSAPWFMGHTTTHARRDQ